MKLFQRLKLNQKGLSMVELICAVAILTILGTTVSGILVVSANSYRRGSAETEVQQDAQLVANQIGDLIIDSTSEVKYAGNKLEINQKDGSGFEINYDSSENELNYKEKYVGGGSSESQLLANNVSKFNVNASNFKKNGSVQMSITISEGSHSYPAVFTITSRNAVPDNAVAEGAAYVSTTVRRWLLEPNQVFNFSSMATASDGTGITWTVENSSPANTSTMTTAGVLTVGKDEAATVLRVKATSGSGASATINVYVRRVNSISVNGLLALGEDHKSGAEYGLASLFTGNSLNQITGAAFDSDYKDTRTVSYSITGGSDASKAHIAGNKLVLDEDMTSGGDIVVTATALHPEGLNKSNTKYKTVTATWTLKNELLFNPIIVLGGEDGWKRLSDTEQATVNSSVVTLMIQALKAADPVKYANLDQNKHHFKVKFRPVGSTGPWQELSYAETKPYAEGYGSGSINMRPLISGMMEPLLDYDVIVTWGFYEGSDNTADTDIWSFEFGQTVRHTSFQVESGYFNGDPKFGWQRSEAPVLNRANKGDVLFSVIGEEITGIEVKNAIQGNHMYYKLEVSTDNGSSWNEVEGGFHNFANADAEFNMDITQKGLYRVSMFLDYGGKAVTIGVVSLGGKQCIEISNEGTKEGIFYFIIDPDATPTPKIVKPYKVNRGSDWGTSDNHYTQYTITFNELTTGKITAIPYTGTLLSDPALNGAPYTVSHDANNIYFQYNGTNASDTLWSLTFNGDSSFALK